MRPRPLSHSTLHPAQLRSLRHRLRLAIRDAGLTDLAAHPRDGDSAPFWELEPTPLVLPAEEWALLERAVRQRARLVDAFLHDIYGPQEVLKARVLPPELVLANPYYRRPCLGLLPAGVTPAPLLRFDLVKTKAGWLFTDTQANTPVGLSYAVQNRRFLAQENGEFYRALPEHHNIINSPLQLLDALHQLAPEATRTPAIVLLTTGPRYPFFSEHAFLARKMGVPLAQGDDLLVLDDRVYLKTIAGLQPVDVIYRRLNDAHIDPVVFSTNRDTAGVPGLLQCLRAGTVVVANAIGSGVAESRGLLPYLPQLLRFYLGERPVLPSVATYTCGDTDQLDHILEHANELQLRPLHARRLGQPEGAVLTLTEGRLPAAVRLHPFDYVAQARPESEPLLPGGRASPPFRLSTFVLTRAGQHTALPGGLVQVGSDEPRPDRLGLTADVVVLAAAEPTTVRPDEGDAERAQRAPLPTWPSSRAAENLFWLGRYLERAEATARMLSILDDVVLEEIPARERRRWVPVWRGLLEATGHAHERITARSNPQVALSDELLRRMTLDRSNPSSLFASVRSAAHNARQLRDYVSPEAGSILTALEQALEMLSGSARRRSRSRFENAPASAVRAVLTHVNAALSAADRTMLHDAAWRFLQVGQLLERSIMTCAALRHVFAAYGRGEQAETASASTQDHPELSALLRMLGSQDAYRRLYQTRSQPARVAELLLLQPEAPRSLTHNLRHLREHLAKVQDLIGSGDDELVRQVTTELETLPALVNDTTTPAEAAAATPSLGQKLGGFLSALYELQTRLSDHYFSHQARLQPTLSGRPPVNGTHTTVV